MIRILEGDCRTVLATLPDRSVQCCVTSPPYYGLRDYGVDGQIGMEQTPDEYVAEMVTVFREVRRVLRDDGVLWLNLGDSYSSSSKGSGGATEKQSTNAGAFFASRKFYGGGAKNKDLLGIPWQVAFALRADGWYLRSEIIWAKPNPMPESVTDRPTKAHEQVFLLSKSDRYFYDADAIAENTEYPIGSREDVRRGGFGGKNTDPGKEAFRAIRDTRNARTIWTIATQPYSGAHFATMPPALAERCIKAGSAKGDTILDPFGGAGTTALVADRLGRDAIIIELNTEYAELARERITQDAGLFAAINPRPAVPGNHEDPKCQEN